MDIKKISRGKKFPEEFNVVIEIPAGSTVKYEFDKDAGAIFVDRLLYTSMAYPANYGFIPGTVSGDGDPLDVLVITGAKLAPASVLAARPIGLLETEDESGEDYKIIAVPTKKIDPYQSEVEDIADLSSATRDKIKHFFERYKESEPGKWVKIKGFLGRKEALKVIKEA